MEEVIINLVFFKVEIQVFKGVGNMILSKKNRNDEELDGWFVGFGGKFKGKKVGVVKNKEKEKIFYFLDVFILFQKVNFFLFMIVGDVVKCVEGVKVKKEYFVKLQIEDREFRVVQKEVVDFKLVEFEVKVVDFFFELEVE